RDSHCIHTLTTQIATLSLHDALPIWFTSTRSPGSSVCSIEPDGTEYGFATNDRIAPKTRKAAMRWNQKLPVTRRQSGRVAGAASDRKSTRLNSSHVKISYAVFCLKKK